MKSKFFIDSEKTTKEKEAERGRRFLIAELALAAGLGTLAGAGMAPVGMVAAPLAAGGLAGAGLAGAGLAGAGLAGTGLAGAGLAGAGLAGVTTLGTGFAASLVNIGRRKGVSGRKKIMYQFVYDDGSVAPNPPGVRGGNFGRRGENVKSRHFIMAY